MKALGFKHENMMEWFQMSVERFLVFKSAQNPDIYHRNLAISKINSLNFVILQ